MTVERVRNLIDEADLLLLASFDTLRVRTPSVASALLEAFGDPIAGMQWVNRTNAFLAGRKPIELIDEQEKDLLELLMRIQYGVYA